MDSTNAARPLDAPDGAADPVGTAPNLLGEIIAVSGNDEFLLELGQLMGAHVIVRPTESVAALADLVVPARPQIVAIECTDVKALEHDLRAASVGPRQIPTVVFVAAAAQRDATPILRRANVKLVLPLPFAPQETRRVLLNELESARAAINARVEAGEHLSVSVLEPAVSRSEPQNPRSRVMLIGAAAAVVLAIAAGGWYFFGRSPTESAAQPRSATAQPQVRPAPTVVGGTVDELLDKAREAIRERRYTEPRDASALLYYRSALAQQPDNAEAKDGLQRLSALVTARLEQALADGRLDVAAQAAADLRSVDGSNPRTGALELRLHTMQMKAAFENGSPERIATALRQAAQSGAVPQEQLVQWRAELSRRQDDARLARLVEQANDRLRNGQLVEPENASAKSLALQARQISATNAGVQRLMRDLGSAMLARAREAGPRTPEGERWLEEARSVGVSAQQIATVQRESAPRARTVSEGDRLAQLFRQRMNDGRIAEPAGDSAATYLAQLRTADAAHAAFEPGRQELAARLLEEARSAAQSKRTDAARQTLALARDFGAEPAALRAVEQLLAPRPQTASGFLFVSHDKLKRTRSAAPDYPEEAYRRSVSGRVQVRFVVDARGEPQNVEVVSAEPPGVFDRAALAAVRRWRYEPHKADGLAVPVETALNIRFAPQ